MLRIAHLGGVLCVFCASVLVAVPATSSGTEGTIPFHQEASDPHGRWVFTIGNLDDQLDSIIRRSRCTNETADRPGSIEHRAYDLKRRLEELSTIGRSIESANDIAFIQHNGIDYQIRIIAAEISRLAAQAATSLEEECTTPFMAPPLYFGTKAGTGSISGMVTDSTTAAAIAQGSILVFDESGGFIGAWSVDSNGDYSTSEGLPAGTYYAQTQIFAGYLDELYDDIFCTLDCDVTTGTPIIVGEGESVTGIDFALEKGASISGTVTEAATDSGIENVVILIYDTAENQVAGGTTDSNGDYFTYQGLPAGTYFVRTDDSSGSHLNEVYDNISCSPSCDVTTGTPIVVGAGESVTGIDFTLDEGGSISGSVTDAATATPIESERVQIYDASGSYITNRYTDNTGAYRFYVGLPTGTYYVRTFSNSGYFNELYDDISCISGCDVTTGTPIVVGVGEAVTGIDFALDKAGSISGTLTDAGTSNPIQGERVRFYDATGDQLGWDYSDENGKFGTNFGLVAGHYFARTSGSTGYLVELYDDIPCSTGCDETTGTPIVVAAGENVTGIDLSLEPGAAISGTVTYSATSDPVQGVDVNVYDSNGNWLVRGYTNASGHYTTPAALSGGTYFARVFPPSPYLDELYDDIYCVFDCDVTSGTPIIVETGVDASEIDFALEKGGSISGTLTDAATADPIEWELVKIYDSSGSQVMSVYSGIDDGDFTTGTILVAGTYFARTSGFTGYAIELFDDIPCHDGCNETNGTPIVVGAGEHVTGIDFALANGGTISGTVIDSANSQPIVNSQVNIFDDDGTFITPAAVYANGEYETHMVLSPGTYYANTYNWAGYYDELYDNIPCRRGCDVTTGTPITVNVYGDVTGINFALDKGGTISGVVTDATTMLPISGVAVHVYDAEGNHLGTDHTDSNGVYLTPSGLVAGTYFLSTQNSKGYADEIYVDIPCLGDCDATVGTPVAVAEGQDVTGIDFSLDPEGGTISGTVTDAAGETGIDGSRVNFFDTEGNTVISCEVDANGDYTTDEDLPPGTYYAATSNWSGYLDELYQEIDCSSECDVTQGTPITVGAGEDVVGIDFTLDKGGSISGRVTDSVNGLGLSGTQIAFFNSDGENFTSAWTGSGGHYKSTIGLVPGTYYARTYGHDGHINELYDNLPCYSSCDATEGTPIVVGAGEDVTGVDFAVDKGGWISGTITDATTLLGVDDSLVRLFDVNGTYINKAQADANGNYSIPNGLPPGNYYAKTYNWAGYFDEAYDDIRCGSGCEATIGTPIMVVGDENITWINFALESGGMISGNVSDMATGIPIDGVKVGIYDSSGNVADSPLTDINGNYISRSGLPTGTYYARTISSAGFVDELYNDVTCPFSCDVTSGTPVAVVSGEVVAGIDFALERGGSISGTVVDAATMAGIMQLQVEIYDADGNIATDGWTDANGEFKTRQGLPAGTYYALTDSSNLPEPYDRELYDNIDCVSGCPIVSGTPIIVGDKQDVVGIDFELNLSPLFADGFEAGNTAAWSTVVGLP